MMNNKTEKELARALKPHKSTLEKAKGVFLRYKWSNKDKEIYSCPDGQNYSEGRTLVHKSLRKNSRLDFVKREYIRLIRCTSKRIEVQVYRVSQVVKQGIENFEFDLVQLERFENNEYTLYNKYTDYKIPFQGYYFQPYEPQAKREVIRELEISELKYLDLHSLDKHVLDWEFLARPKDILGRMYKYRDVIEYCQKIGANNLACDIVSGQADMRLINAKRLRQYKQLLKHHDLTSTQFSSYLKLAKRCGNINVSLLKESYYFTYFNFCLLMPEGIKPQKFMDYLTRQSKEIDDVLNTYRDYRNMIGQLEVGTTDASILLPKNLKFEHDRLSERITLSKNMDKNLLYQKRLKTISKLNCTIGEYQFRVPRDVAEIVKEGTELHHCVGSYVSSVSKGSTTIIFVRKVDEPDTPFVTMEIGDQRIKQIRGLRNSSPKIEVLDASEQFINRAKKENIPF